MLDKDLIHRVADWNAVRYSEPKFDLLLFKAMIVEEYDEYLWATQADLKLDALGDLLFVTLGGYWKLNYAPYRVLKQPYGTNVALIYNRNDYLHATVVGLSKYPGDFGIEFILDYLCNAVICEFHSLGYSEQDMNDTLTAICDSNDTKEVVQLDADEKGSMKGAKFEPPTAALLAIANRYKFEDM